MKLSHVLQKLLTNKIVLNIVCALSAFNIVGYLVLGKLTAALFFIVLAILITHFSKNMIVVLGVPLILVNFLVVTGLFNRIEGFEDNGTQAKEKASSAKANETPQQQAQIKADKAKLQKDKDAAKTNNTTDPTSSTTTTDESFEVGRAKRRGAGPQIDYAATVEDAYDQLNSILGSDGIKSLTGDTQKLMKQQMELAESMKTIGPLIKNMGPIMKQAEGLLGSMNDGDGEGGLSSIMEMAKKFAPKK